MGLDGSVYTDGLGPNSNLNGGGGKENFNPQRSGFKIAEEGPGGFGSR